MTFHRRLPAVAHALLAFAGLVAAQPAVELERPRFLDAHIEYPRLRLEVEGDRQVTRFYGQQTTTDEILDWTPFFGMQVNGSVYDPRLLQFNIETDNGITWGRRNTDDGVGGGEDYNRNFILSRYRATLNFLKDESYPVTVFATRSRERRDYDQFSRFYADTENHGAGIRGLGTPVTWNLRYAHSDEQIDNPARPNLYREDLVTLDADYARTRHGRTTLRYSDQSFRRRDGTAPVYDGLQQSLYVMDQSNFDTNLNDRLLSSLSYNDLSRSSRDSSVLILREDLRGELLPRFWSGATYQYDRRSLQGTGYSSHNGSVYIEQQRPEPLLSRLDVQLETSRGAGDSYRRAGPGLTERYTQKLGSATRLNVNLEGRLDVIRRTISGSQVVVVGERLTLDDQHPAFLALPHVVSSSVVVSDASGARQYLEGFDYRVIPRGAVTEIQRVFGGAIPAGSTVRVDYVADAGTADSLTRFSRRAGLELDLYDRMVLLYADHRAAESSGDRSLIYGDYQDTVAGIKSRWSWIEIGVEHVDHSSDTLGYGGVNYFVDLFWNGDRTSAKLHAGHSDLQYKHQGGELVTRNYTATVNWTPVGGLTLQGFAGNYLEENTNGDRELRTLEARLLYRYSSVYWDGSYRYERESTRDLLHERHYFLLRLTRDL